MQIVSCAGESNEKVAASLLKNLTWFDNNDGIKFQTLRSSCSQITHSLVQSACPRFIRMPQLRLIIRNDNANTSLSFALFAVKAFLQCGDDLRDAFLERVLVCI